MRFSASTTAASCPAPLPGRPTRDAGHSEVSLTTDRVARFRYLLITAGPADVGSTLTLDNVAEQVSHREPARPSPHPVAPPAAGSARYEILATAKRLAGQSADETFTLMQILTEMRRASVGRSATTSTRHSFAWRAPSSASAG
jgi:hypothetical protein